MRIGTDDPIWVVTNAAMESMFEDICFKTTIRGLARQFIGGLNPNTFPTIHTDYELAKWDAEHRLAYRDKYVAGLADPSAIKAAQ